MGSDKTENSLDNKDWKTVTLSGQSITPFKPEDLHQFRFRVQTDQIPVTSLAEYGENPITMLQPVLINDGKIYEKDLLDALYNRQFFQYVLLGDPRNYKFEEFSQALYVSSKTQGWKCFIFHNKDYHQVIKLPQHIQTHAKVAPFLLKYATTFSANLLGQDVKSTIESANFPIILNDFLLKKIKYQPQELNVTMNQRLIAAHDQQIICFSYTGLMPSKLDSKKNLSPNEALVGIFRCEDQEHTTSLMVEKRDKHNCGRINVYQFQYFPKTEEKKEIIRINKTIFRDEDYAALDHQTLMNQYKISDRQLEARLFKTTNEKTRELAKQIKLDQDRIGNGRIEYSKRAGKFLVESVALFFGIFSKTEFNYHNEATWCITVLLAANILAPGEPLTYEKDYRIQTKPSFASFFLGKTPDRAMPLPRNILTAKSPSAGN